MTFRDGSVTHNEVRLLVADGTLLLASEQSAIEKYFRPRDITIIIPPIDPLKDVAIQLGETYRTLNCNTLLLPLGFPENLFISLSKKIYPEVEGLTTSSQINLMKISYVVFSGEVRPLADDLHRDFREQVAAFTEKCETK